MLFNKNRGSLECKEGLKYVIYPPKYISAIESKNKMNKSHIKQVFYAFLYTSCQVLYLLRETESRSLTMYTSMMPGLA